MEELNIKKEYGKEKLKYKELPDFDTINNEFEINDLESSFLLRNIRRKMVEKIDYYSVLLEEVLHPENSLKNLYECRVFTEKDKDNIYTIFKRLVFYLRYSAEVALEAKTEKDVGFIRDLNKEWIKIKPNLLKIISKIKDSWEKDTELKEDSGYFG